MAAQSLTRQAVTRITRSFGKEQLLTLVAEGTSTRKIATIVSDQLGKSYSQYYIVKALQSFGEEYEQAKKAQALLHAERISEVAGEVEEGRIDPASARVSSDNRKWLASRLNPREYGDKIQAEIQVTDMTHLHLEALRLKMQSRVVEARVIEDKSGEEDTEVSGS